MDTKEYTRFVSSMKVYPGQCTQDGLNYAIIALVGEAGEAANVLKKILRGDASNSVELHNLKNKLILELGDIAFYLECAANELGFTLEDVMRHNIVKLERRNKAGEIKSIGGERSAC